VYYLVIASYIETIKVTINICVRHHHAAFIYESYILISLTCQQQCSTQVFYLEVPLHQYLSRRSDIMVYNCAVYHSEVDIDIDMSARR
jgi:hypothetical protein